MYKSIFEFLVELNDTLWEFTLQMYYGDPFDINDT